MNANVNDAAMEQALVEAAVMVATDENSNPIVPRVEAEDKEVFIQTEEAIN